MPAARVVRRENDDWDDATHTTQYLVRLYEAADRYIEIYLDTSAEELVARGNDGDPAWSLEADTSAYSDAAWYDVILRWSATNAELYVNGVSAESKNNPKLPDGVTDIHVGTDEAAADPWKSCSGMNSHGPDHALHLSPCSGPARTGERCR